MIKRILFYILLGIPTFSFSQKLKVGIGLIANENAFNRDLISINDLTIFEGNQKSSDPVILPYLGYGYAISRKFYAQIGVQYYRNGISLFVNNPVQGAPNVPDAGKVRNVINRNLEFPLEFSFTILQTKQVNWKLRGGLVPVWSLSSSFQMTEVPEGPDWSQEVVDALNAAKTIPKSFYMNYQYGLALSFGRFEFSLFQSANLSRSISNGYTLNGTTYAFDRRISSTRIGLYYSIWLKKEKE